MADVIKGRPRNVLTEQDIRRAMKHSVSNRGAARVLNVSLPTYKLYASQCTDQETGKTLYEIHSNSAGKGIRKFKKDYDGTSLMELLREGVDITSFSIDKLKNRLLYEGALAYECSKCQFCEPRVTDYKVPLLLNFKDKNKSNWTLENLEMLCYNCFFLYVGDIYTKQQINIIEDFGAPAIQSITPDWELDEYFKQHFENLGLMNTDEDPGSEFIAKL